MKHYLRFFASRFNHHLTNWLIKDRDLHPFLCPCGKYERKSNGAA